MLEVEKGGFSIEPFLYVDGTLVDWSTMRRRRQALDDGYLPIPSVHWDVDQIGLDVTAFAAGEPRRVDAVRPLPRREPPRPPAEREPLPRDPAVPGRSAVAIAQHGRRRGPDPPIRFDGGAVWVNRRQAGDPRHAARSSSAPTSIESGSITRLPARREGAAADRSRRIASASRRPRCRYDLRPRRRARSDEVAVAVPFHADGTLHAAVRRRGARSARSSARRRARRWKRAARARRASSCPPQASAIARVLKSTLAYILINRDGPRLQPGPRNYARSWIRDGALTSAALLADGIHAGAARVPRVVRAVPARRTARFPAASTGAAPIRWPSTTATASSSIAVAEYYRYTRDIGFLTEMWPRVVRAVDYLDGLRRQRMTDDLSDAGEGGLLRPAAGIDQPRGLRLAARSTRTGTTSSRCARFKDAAAPRGRHGRRGARRELRGAARRLPRRPLRVDRAHDGGTRDRLRAGLGRARRLRPDLDGDRARSRGRAREPAAARRSDARSTSTTRSSASGATARRVGTRSRPTRCATSKRWCALDRRQQAFDVLDFMLADQRPTGWNEWQEIVWRDSAMPSFIGDMPHTWVGCELRACGADSVRLRARVRPRARRSPPGCRERGSVRGTRSG